LAASLAVVQSQQVVNVGAKQFFWDEYGQTYIKPNGYKEQTRFNLYQE